DEATAGALDLAATIPSPGGPVEDAGLYAGLAGHVFVLRAAHRVSGSKPLGDAARRGAQALAAAARRSSSAVSWSDTTDIISGTAGIGLTLLTITDLLGDQAIELARGAGDHLLAAAKP